MPDGPNATRPWWIGPGPLGFGGLVLVACVAVGWQGFAEARKPVDVRARDQQLMRGGSFCDTPSAPRSSAVPPAGFPAVGPPAGR